MGCEKNMHLIADIERLRPIYNFFGIHVFTAVGFDVSHDIKEKYPSVVRLSESDEYTSCPTKMANAILHAVDNYDFDYLICCDDDTVLNPNVLLGVINNYYTHQARFSVLGQIRGGTRDTSNWTVHPCGGPGFVLTHELAVRLYPFLQTGKHNGEYYSDVAFAKYLYDYDASVSVEERVSYINSTRFKNLVYWSVGDGEYDSDGLTWDDLKTIPHMIRRYATIHLTRPNETGIIPSTPYDFFMKYFNII